VRLGDEILEHAGKRVYWSSFPEAKVQEEKPD
jgi:hypothetical protein